MRLLSVATVLALLAANGLAVAQGADEHPIDVALSRCLDKPDTSTTQAMVECLDEAYAAWDTELNSVYDAVTEILDTESQELLRTSQRQWLAWRDAERAFWQGPWPLDRGTMIQLTLGQANIDLVRARVDLLKGYLPEP